MLWGRLFVLGVNVFAEEGRQVVVLGFGLTGGPLLCLVVALGCF